MDNNQQFRELRRILTEKFNSGTATEEEVRRLAELNLQGRELPDAEGEQITYGAMPSPPSIRDTVSYWSGYDYPALGGLDVLASLRGCGRGSPRSFRKFRPASTGDKTKGALVGLMDAGSYSDYSTKSKAGMPGYGQSKWLGPYKKKSDPVSEEIAYMTYRRDADKKKTSEEDKDVSDMKELKELIEERKRKYSKLPFDQRMR